MKEKDIKLVFLFFIIKASFTAYKAEKKNDSKIATKKEEVKSCC